MVLGCCAAVAAAPVPKPGFVLDVADQIFPAFKKEVRDAVLESIESITKAVQDDASEFIKAELSNVFFLPQSVADRLSGFLKKRIVSKIGTIISQSIKLKLPGTVDSVFKVLKNEIRRIDGGVDSLALDYRNHIRELFRLPPSKALEIN